VDQIGPIYQQYKEQHPGKTWYILDACQSIGQIPLDVQELHCDFCSVTVRKFLRGPRGTGLLYISDKALQAGLEPLFIDMRGADWVEKNEYKQKSTAMRFEDWEFPYALVLGAAAAIRYYLDIDGKKIQQQINYLSSLLRNQLSAISPIRLLDHGPNLGGLITFTIEGQDPVNLVNRLRSHHINIVPSYRNFAVIDFDEKGVKWALRASPHYYNTEEELTTFTDTLKTLI
jgi:selenocysteine lyase/cysteine desulfurase